MRQGKEIGRLPGKSLCRWIYPIPYLYIPIFIDTSELEIYFLLKYCYTAPFRTS